MQTTPLQPIVIYVQAATPTDTTEGKLWLRSTDGSLFVAHSGAYVTTGLSSLQTKAINIAPNALCEHSLNTLKLAIAAAQPAASYYSTDNTFADIFSAAAGAASTINTGATTAYFNSNLYQNQTTTSGTWTSPTLTEDVGNSGKYGIKFTLTAPAYITTSSIPATSVPLTKWYLGTTNGGSEIATGTISAGVATINQLLAAGAYYLTADNGGSSYNLNANAAAAFPYTLSTFCTINSRNDGITNTADNIANIVFTNSPAADKIIQTNALTIPTSTINPTYFLVYSNKASTGTGSVNCDVSFDNGSTYTTGININTLTTITSTTGSSIVLKLNLNAGASNGTATASNYGIIWF